MTIHFAIDYHTRWGESLYLRLSAPEAKSLEMAPVGSSRWVATLEPDAEELSYTYEVRRGDDVVRSEWGSPHKLVASKSAAEYEVFDRWQDVTDDKPFFSQAFTECINRRETASQPLALQSGHLMLTAEAPAISPDCELVVCGNCPELGSWDPAKAPVMDSAEFPLWAVNIPLVNLPERVEYKLVKVTAKSRRVVAWERGDNRILDLSGFNREVAVRITLPPYADDMPGWRGAGVAIPVFSLRSEDDFGVGDFYDLKKLVDWAEKTGQRFIQILPVNDTTMTHSWSDSYPYNANSTFALHPMYLRLEELGRLNDKSQMAYYEEMRKELNALADVDYEAVNRLKTQYTREMFNQDGDNTL
ncbi:MAG: 4-alpha-glucanotransferase, partial [Muribaculaceae bacterium]|nr:4-alpha-glucanotransferase [Muribaculaceae bacterium]